MKRYPAFKYVVVSTFLLFSILFRSAYAEKPSVSISFSKNSYAIGEPVIAHYKINFSGEYSEIRCAWWIITDWEEEEAQCSSENDQELVSPEGDVKFTPSYGEGIICEISLTEKTGEWHHFKSDPIRLTGDYSSAPECSISFSKDSYVIGEPVTAHYEIDFSGEYSEIRCAWWIITDWEGEEAQYSSGNDQELVSPEGDVKFTPSYGEGIICEISLTEKTGEWHHFKSDSVRLHKQNTAILPDSLTVIGREAFANSSFSYVVCPKRLISIESRAFANCKNLLTINIPDSVESIADDAFEGCISLITVIGTKNSTAARFAQKHGYTFVDQ